MQYAVFSDIHGHFEALRAVWQKLEDAGLADGPVLNAGDNVGYGDAPEECVQFLRDHPNVLNVRGNYDKTVAAFPERDAEYRKKWVRSRPEKYEALRVGSAAISDATRRWLLDLPVEVSVTWDEVPIVLVHYAPGHKEGLGHWTTDDRLRELAAETNAKVVVCGHTHTSFVRDVGGVLWVNPGSMGRSWDGCACYAVLKLEPGQPPRAELKAAS